MENESNISLGGALNLHTLIALPIFIYFMKIGVFLNSKRRRRTLFANLCVRDEGKTLKRSNCAGGGEGMYLAGGGGEGIG